ncbi:uncharacterized protein LOC129942469 [Eupeodes corollae]|uniref:uncharacterized protein LOC129942469 n=1 Tax=Eupeodes corollae TaxID=290404 RepID=UPI00248FAF29|nr:uncharacterized protein LOC129942469 [Eupeodes corollae]
MQSDVVLAHYDPQLPLVLATEASPFAVGAVLSHIFSDGSERPIQYATQTLSDVQQRYSQIDREAYAIVFGIKKMYHYVWGCRFTLVIDNKPISQIFQLEKGCQHCQQRVCSIMQFFWNPLTMKYDASDRKKMEMRMRYSDYRLNKQIIQIEEVDHLEVNAINNLPVSV